MSRYLVTRHLPADATAAALREDVLRGLTAAAKWLPPKWFYDARGSELFEDITRLPEYYPTRTERAILAAHAAEIARITDAKALVELGSGSSEKTGLLLDALLGHGTLGAFTPLDVSSAALGEAVERLAQRYPGLAVRGVADGIALIAQDRGDRLANRTLVVDDQDLGIHSGLGHRS